MVTGYGSDVSQLRIFSCVVCVPIAPPHRTKMGLHRRLPIYVGYEFATIVRYIESLTCDLFTARFVDCHFDEAVFPSLGRNKNKNVQ